MKINELIAEILDNPYSGAKRWSGYDGEHRKNITLPDGRTLSIQIQTDPNYYAALVNFTVDREITATGGGDAFRILTTVAREISDFARKRKPALIGFTAAEKEPSRIKLYDRFVPRMFSMDPVLSQYEDITDGTYSEAVDEFMEFADELHAMSDQKLYLYAGPKFWDYGN